MMSNYTSEIYTYLRRRRSAAELILITMVGIVAFSLGCAMGRLSTPIGDQHITYLHAHGRYGVFH